MEFRIHNKLEKELSVIGIDSSYWSILLQDDVNTLLSIATENLVNHLVLYPNTIDFYTEWLKSIGYISYFTHFLGLPFAKDFEQQIDEILRKIKKDNIEFLIISNLDYHDEKLLSKLEQLEKLKETGKIEYLGVHAMYIHDAIQFVKHKLVDFVLVSLSMLNSPDLLKNLFSACHISNIPIFAVNEYNQDINTEKQLNITQLENQIIDGKKILKHNLIEAFNWSKRSIEQISVRFLLDKQINSLFVPFCTSTHLEKTLKILSIPPLTQNDLNLIQKSIDFDEFFESPKRGKS